MKTKIWNWIGMAAGLVAIIVGIVFAASSPDSYYTEHPDYSAYGADFYTDEYGATRAVAINTQSTVYLVKEIGGKIAGYAGWLFILGGLLIIVRFGRKMALDTAAEQETQERGQLIHLLTEIRDSQKQEPVEKPEEQAVPQEEPAMATAATPVPEEKPVKPGANEGKGAVPVPAENGKVICPLCGTVQRADRSRCMECGAIFAQEEQK